MRLHRPEPEPGRPAGAAAVRCACCPRVTADVYRVEVRLRGRAEAVAVCARCYEDGLRREAHDRAEARRRWQLLEQRGRAA